MQYKLTETAFAVTELKELLYPVLNTEFEEYCNDNDYIVSTEEVLENFHMEYCNSDNDNEIASTLSEEIMLEYTINHIDYVNTMQNDMLGEDITVNEILNKLRPLIIYWIGEEWKQLKLEKIYKDMKELEKLFGDIPDEEDKDNKTKELYNLIPDNVKLSKKEIIEILTKSKLKL